MKKKLYFNKDFLRRKEKLVFRHYILIAFLTTLLTWKLLRGIDPNPISWHIHNIFLVLLAVLSFFTLYGQNFKFKRNDMSVFFFGFCLLIIIRILIFRDINSFTLASLVFCSYFFLTNIFKRISADLFFRFFEIIFLLVVLINIGSHIEFLSGLNIVKYKDMEAIEGVMPIVGARGGRPLWSYFSDYVGFTMPSFSGRLSGVAGTPYASSALMAAIAIYAVVAKKKMLTVIAVFALLLSGTRSTALAFLVSLVILNVRKLSIIPIIMLSAFFGYVLIFEAKGGINPNLYLSLEFEGSTLYALAYFLLGEGSQVSSLSSEIRALGMFLSLGMIGIFCLILIFMQSLNIVRLYKLEPKQKYKAMIFLILTLFLSSFHYNTFFVYPNIMFVVVFISFVASRYRLYYMTRFRTGLYQPC